MSDSHSKSLRRSLLKKNPVNEIYNTASDPVKEYSGHFVHEKKGVTSMLKEFRIDDDFRLTSEGLTADVHNALLKKGGRDAEVAMVYPTYIEVSTEELGAFKTAAQQPEKKSLINDLRSYPAPR